MAYKIKNDMIFRGNDLRGKYPDDIDEDVAYTIGRSFGSVVLDRCYKTVVSGKDIRSSSPSLHSSLIRGLLDSGVDVINLGTVTTPMYYYASMFLGIPSGVMVTASHNPKEDNGFKIQLEGTNLIGEEINKFKDFTKEFNFKTGEGKLYRYDIKPAYLKLFKNSLKIPKDKKLKVVVDLANATTCVVAKEIFSMFQAIDANFIFDTIDPSFPNHHPDPAVESNLDFLKKKVVDLNADLGISYDGDGDRVGVIDNKGNYITIDKIMIIFIRSLINKSKKKTYIYDVKCSKTLGDEIDKLKGIKILNRTGNSYLRRRLNEEDSILAGEFSGHIFFKDRFPGFDSGIYASLRLIEIMMDTGKTIEELLEGVPKYFSSPEIKVPTRDEIKFDVVEKVKKELMGMGYNSILVDGIRIEAEDSWALVRASNTGPNLTLRFEAETEDKLKKLENLVMNIVNKYNSAD